MNSSVPIVVLAVTCALLLWRWVRRRHYPLGVFWRIESPDGRYSAASGTIFNRFLLKRDRSWPSFIVYDEPSSARIYEQEFPELESLMGGNESINDISWSRDGRTVSFILDRRAITTVDLQSLTQINKKQEAS